MGKVNKLVPKGAPKAKRGGHGSYKAKRHPGSKVNKQKK
jgi:hypothetical protein